MSHTSARASMTDRGSMSCAVLGVSYARLTAPVVQMLLGDGVGKVKLQPVLIQKVRALPASQGQPRATPVLK